MNVAETLKASRKMLRLSQRQLTEMTGISRQTISRYETGAVDPTYELQRLLWAMGLELCVRRRQK